MHPKIKHSKKLPWLTKNGKMIAMRDVFFRDLLLLLLTAAAAANQLGFIVKSAL
jgi:hypothetical protein